MNPDAQTVGRQLPGRFRLGNIDVSPIGNTLSHGGVSVSIERRIMLVLCVLAERPGRVVTRDQMLERVWGTDHSADESINRAISILRKALREVGGPADYIQTIPKRGYRLLSAVAANDEQSTARRTGNRSPSGSGRKFLWPPLLIAATIAVFLANRAGLLDREPSAPVRSVAVLPFVAMSAEQSDELFAVGLSEELLNALAKLSDLKVSARTSSFTYKDRSTSVKTIGRELGVAYVLEGSIRRTGERVRIAAKLVSVDTGYSVWSETYDRALDDVFLVQEEIARRVAEALESKVLNALAEPVFNAGTQNTDAFALQLKARDYLNRRGLGLSRAIANFESAIEADPQYARAYAGLATSHVVSHIYLNVPKELARQRATNFANIAIDMDPTLSEPLAVLGVIEADQNRWSEALALYEQAETLDPSDVVVLQWHAELLSYVGYIDRASDKIQEALAVDGKSAILNLIAGNIAFARGDLVATDMFYRLAADYGLSDGTNGSSLVELSRGNLERAAQMMAVTQFNDQRVSADDVKPLGAFVLELMRRRAKVDDGIDAFPALATDDDFRMPAYLIAGESERALETLANDPDGDHDSFYLLWTNIDPGLRRSAAFESFVDLAGLLEFWQRNGWPDRCLAPRPEQGRRLDCR